MKAIENSNSSLVSSKPECISDYHLIDLFVDLCFTDIKNPTLIFQFEILAIKLGYSHKQIKKVVQIGKREYEYLFQKIHEDFTNELLT